MILQVFDKIRNYQITYYYNMLILSQIGNIYKKNVADLQKRINFA